MVITIWEIFDKTKKEFKFNHIADGYDESLTKPKSDIPKQQKAWNGSTWRKFEAKLIDGKVIRE